ncbi:MAG: L-serine ammonia-lyase, iron-sulfur-dependent, subunit alpha [Flexilinea sp.]|nr:L-serine ammonia-lyase, iron-sulfur-dependent, subunit alpha [Flexilinea sp.]
MDTIKHLFRIGYGPSSSHTMGPKNAAEHFLGKNPNANHFTVTLYGSLAATGRGHMTDRAILDILGDDRTTIIWQPEVVLPYHPNGMEFESFDESGTIIDDWTVYSVGGGRIDDKGDRIPPETVSNVYPHRNMDEIQRHLFATGMNFWEYVEECEGSDIWDYLREVWTVMSDAVDRGVREEGVIPGGLGITRKANLYFRRSQLTRDGFIHSTPMTAFALAVSEENATGGKIVTAPTCGSCGVVPAVLRYFQKKMDITEDNILRALATAGVFGNVVKHCGSISGAEAGCQAEIGVACAMAAAAASYFYSGTSRQIEYAAESGLEHHLGLTCDPVAGLVQVPCIERNAAAANAALFAAQFVMFSDGSHRLSFDDVVSAMMHTGLDMPSLYRETSEGGLAKVFRFPNGE